MDRAVNHYQCDLAKVNDEIGHATILLASSSKWKTCADANNSPMFPSIDTLLTRLTESILGASVCNCVDVQGRLVATLSIVLSLTDNVWWHVLEPCLRPVTTDWTAFVLQVRRNIRDALFIIKPDPTVKRVDLRANVKDTATDMSDYVQHWVS